MLQNRGRNTPKSIWARSGTILGILGALRDAPGTRRGRAGDAPGCSGDAPGDPRASQERPGTPRGRARDAPETLQRRSGTRLCRRTAVKTPADRFSSVFRMTRHWAEMRFDMVFTIRNADRAFCATGASEQPWRTKNEPFRPPETKPRGGRAPKFERKKRKTRVGARDVKRFF